MNSQKEQLRQGNLLQQQELLIKLEMGKATTSKAQKDSIKDQLKVLGESYKSLKPVPVPSIHPPVCAYFV
eukprot:Pgem_evm1s18183